MRYERDDEEWASSIALLAFRSWTLAEPLPQASHLPSLRPSVMAGLCLLTQHLQVHYDNKACQKLMFDFRVQGHEKRHYLASSSGLAPLLLHIPGRTCPPSGPPAENATLDSNQARRGKRKVVLHASMTPHMPAVLKADRPRPGVGTACDHAYFGHLS